MSGTRTTRVGLEDRAYDITAGPGLLERAGLLMAPLLRGGPVAVVTDANVRRHQYGRLKAGLDDAGITAGLIELPPGEATKSFTVLEDLLNRLLDAGMDRSGTIIAFGGGVIGDLAGLAAAVVLRGVDCIQVPTTLLAQVDSSVGGKTAIDTRHGKNLVGAFHQPRLVLADTTALRTLPPREIRAGYAEIVKYGLIDRPGFFAWLEANGNRVLALDDDALTHAVTVSCEAKAAVVEADERESGSRALLNLGHTFGHAFEAEAGYGDALLHGEAVALGMVLAFGLSVRLGFCPPADLERVRRHIAAAGLPTAPPGNNAAFARHDMLIKRRDTLIQRMRRDKKARSGRVVLVLARAIGEAFLHGETPEAELAMFLDHALAATVRNVVPEREDTQTVSQYVCR